MESEEVKNKRGGCATLMTDPCGSGKSVGEMQSGEELSGGWKGERAERGKHELRESQKP